MAVSDESRIFGRIFSGTVRVAAALCCSNGWCIFNACFCARLSSLLVQHFDGVRIRPDMAGSSRNSETLVVRVRSAINTFNTFPIAFSRWQMVDLYCDEASRRRGSACGVRALQRHDQTTGGIMGLLPLLLSSTERSKDEGSKNKRHTTTYGSPTLSLGRRRTWHPWHSCPFSFVEMSTLNACTLDLGFWDETPSRDGQLSGYVCSSSQDAQTHPCYIRGFWSVEETYTPRNGQFALTQFLFIFVNKSCGSIHPTWSWGTAPVTQKIWNDIFQCLDVHPKREMPNTDILSHIYLKPNYDISRFLNEFHYI